MSKNKDEENLISDAFDTIRELIEFHGSLTAMITTLTPRTGVDTALTKIEEHINYLLSKFDFSPDEQEEA